MRTGPELTARLTLATANQTARGVYLPLSASNVDQTRACHLTTSAHAMFIGAALTAPVILDTVIRNAFYVAVRPTWIALAACQTPSEIHRCACAKMASQVWIATSTKECARISVTLDTDVKVQRRLIATTAMITLPGDCQEFAYATRGGRVRTAQ